MNESVSWGVLCRRATCSGFMLSTRDGDSPDLSLVSLFPVCRPLPLFALGVPSRHLEEWNLPMDGSCRRWSSCGRIAAGTDISEGFHVIVCGLSCENTTINLTDYISGRYFYVIPFGFFPSF